MAPQVREHPGTRPTENEEEPVDEHTISPAGDAFYAASRRSGQNQEVDRPCYCYGSGVVVLTYEEDGQEHDEAVLCRRCTPVPYF
jgi:hypothetical protein